MIWTNTITLKSTISIGIVYNSEYQCLAIEKKANREYNRLELLDQDNPLGLKH